MAPGGYWAYWWKYFEGIIAPSIAATVRMLSASMLLSLVLGFALAYFLVLYAPTGLRPDRSKYSVLDFIVNSVRSFPIIILIVAISPVTRLVVGTSIGEKAAVLPLTIAATPFMARIIENSLKSVDAQLIEAARSFGASDFQIIIKVMAREAIPSIVAGTTLATITFLSATTMAGAVGAGGRAPWRSTTATKALTTRSCTHPC